MVSEKIAELYKKNNIKIQQKEKQIEDAEAKKDKLIKLMDKYLKEGNIEEYTEVAIRVTAYNNFIEGNNAFIEDLKNNAFTEEELNEISREAESYYKTELRKLSNEFVKKFNSMNEVYEKFYTLTNKYLNDDRTLRVQGSKINSSITMNNVDVATPYHQQIVTIKRIIDNKPQY